MNLNNDGRLAAREAITAKRETNRHPQREREREREREGEKERDLGGVAAAPRATLFIGERFSVLVLDLIVCASSHPLPFAWLQK